MLADLLAWIAQKVGFGVGLGLGFVIGVLAGVLGLIVFQKYGPIFLPFLRNSK